MPYMTNGKRDYKKEDAWDRNHKTREADRAKRHAARAAVAKKKGVAMTSLNGDVGHKKAVSRGGTNSMNNLFVQNPGQNRSFARNADGSMKSETSKRERKKR